jgi:hypothetical protein
MTNPNLAHPNEEALERFLLRRSDDQELELVETHILACEDCITRLEALETQLVDLKTALVAARDEQLQQQFAQRPSFWGKWLTFRHVSWAGAACAALAVAFVVTPGVRHPNSIPVTERSLSACAASDANLASCRGVETAALPAGTPLSLRLDTTDIPAGPVDAQIVNGNGREIWQGQTAVQNQRAELKLPRIGEPGPYFLRLYAPSASSEHELLREYRFEVK